MALSLALVLLPSRAPTASVSAIAEDLELILYLPVTEIVAGERLAASIILTNFSDSGRHLRWIGGNGYDTKLGSFRVWSADNGQQVFPQFGLEELYFPNDALKIGGSPLAARTADRTEACDLASRYALTKSGRYWISAWTHHPSTNHPPGEEFAGTYFLLETPPLLVTIAPGPDPPPSTDEVWSESKEKELNQLSAFLRFLDGGQSEPLPILREAKAGALRRDIARLELLRQQASPAGVIQMPELAPGSVGTVRVTSMAPSTTGFIGHWPSDLQQSGTTTGSESSSLLIQLIWAETLWPVLVVVPGALLAWWLLRRRGGEPPSSK